MFEWVILSEGDANQWNGMARTMKFPQQEEEMANKKNINRYPV